MGSVDSYQLNNHLSEERRKKKFPVLHRKNCPATLTIRMHSLDYSLCKGLRFSVISPTRKLSSYLPYHSSLFGFSKYKIKTITGWIPEGSQQEGRCLGGGLFYRENEQWRREQEGGLRRIDKDGRDHPGDKENMSWRESWGSSWAFTVANC